MRLLKKLPLYKIILLLIIISTQLHTTSVYCQSDSLYHYLEIAASNNPVVQQKFAEYQAALQKVPQVGSLPDPEINVGVFLSPMELIAGNQIADIRLMQMFPWFGVLKNAKDEMSLMAKAKYELFRDAKLQVFYDVQRSWFELYKINEEIKISEKNSEILHSLERLDLVKFKSGTTGNSNSGSSNSTSSASNSTNNSAGSNGSQSMGANTGNVSAKSSSAMSSSVMGNSSSGGSALSDLYKIQMEIGDLGNNIAMLHSQYNTIQARFNSYLNRKMTMSVVIADTLPSDSIDISLNAVSDSMLKNNPMLGMLKYEQQSIEARKKMVTRMGYPMVGIGVNYSLINKSEMSTSSMNGSDMIMPMVTVTLPVYRKKYKAMRNEADLLKTANDQNIQATANALQNEYYEAMQMYQDAQRRIALFKSQCILADKSMSIEIKSFSTSGAGLSDILRIHQQILDFNFKDIEAVVDFNISVAWLKRLGNIEINQSIKY